MKYYVYQLIDPRDSLPFYIGKGTGNRINQHEKEAKANIDSKKCEVIREIESLGLSVIKEKIKFFDDEEKAYLYEKSLIDSIGLNNLTNISGGISKYNKNFADSADIILVSCVATLLKKTRGNYKDATLKLGSYSVNVGKQVESIISNSFSKLLKAHGHTWVINSFAKHRINVDITVVNKEAMTHLGVA